MANVASDLRLVRANYGAETDSYTAANLVTTQAVKGALEERWQPAMAQHFPDRKSRFSSDHRR